MNVSMPRSSHAVILLIYVDITLYFSTNRESSGTCRNINAVSQFHHDQETQKHGRFLQLTNGREAQKHGRFLADLLKDLGLAVLGDVMCHNELAMRSCNRKREYLVVSPDVDRCHRVPPYDDP